MKWAVRILLECILAKESNLSLMKLQEDNVFTGVCLLFCSGGVPCDHYP